MFPAPALPRMALKVSERSTPRHATTGVRAAPPGAAASAQRQSAMTYLRASRLPLDGAADGRRLGDRGGPPGENGVERLAPVAPRDGALVAVVVDRAVVGALAAAVAA